MTPLGYIPNINSLLLLESMMLRSTLLDRKFRSYSFSSLHEFTSWHFTFNFAKFLSYSFRLVLSKDPLENGISSYFVLLLLT